MGSVEVVEVGAVMARAPGISVMLFMLALTSLVESLFH
jgi:hypothetical protein